MIRIVISLFLALSTPSLQAEEAAKLNHSTSRKCQDSDSAIPMEESLKTLAEKLTLNEPQKPLWDSWAQQLLRAHHTKDEFNRTAAERRKLPAPERQEKWMASVETHLQAMRESLPALRTLYASFNDKQREVFDSEVPFKHHGCGTPTCKSCPSP